MGKSLKIIETPRVSATFGAALQALSHNAQSTAPFQVTLR